MEGKVLAFPDLFSTHFKLAFFSFSIYWELKERQAG